MCGVAGLLTSKDPANLEPTLRGMLAALRHRGPDDEGLAASRSGSWAIGLAATRLAILDLSPAGHQPMFDDAGRCIVYNGEIYNFKELREKLQPEPGGWRSGSDTEVILRGIAQRGLPWLQELRGMFAFAFWDPALHRLLLARDPFGIKPLYYCAAERFFAFSSEVRCLLRALPVPRRLDPGGLASFLSFGSVEEPLTLIQGVRSVPPGHWLTVDLSSGTPRISSGRWANAQDPAETAAGPTRPESARQVREALEDSVRCHLVSDVPVGAFLSGGVDSSAVVALMSHLSREKPRTFCVTFQEGAFSESAYAGTVARRYGTEHREVRLSEQDLLELLPKALRAMDQPTLDGINTYVVSKAAKEAGMRVILSGLGGDELFGGYPSFRRIRWSRWLQRIPQGARGAISHLASGLLRRSARVEKGCELLRSGMDPWDVYVASRRLFSPRTMQSLCPLLDGRPDPPAWAPAPEGQDPFHLLSSYEMSHYMVNTLLRDTDFMSMAHSLEVRVPFIDREVVEAVRSVPSAHQVDGQRPKPLLVDAVRDLLPPEIGSRPKAGFVLPFERWMCSSLRDEVHSALSDPAALAPLGLQPDVVKKVWLGFLRDPKAVGWARPWSLYVLARWSQLHGVTR